jgi:hypothetical protein
MNTRIKTAVLRWLEHHPTSKQWLWFVALWCGGLMGVTALTYPLKLLIKSMR